MATTTAPFPVRDPLAERSTGLMTMPWINWFTQLVLNANAAPARLVSVTATAQNAAIGTTSFALGALASGLYRVSYMARITTAATTSSSLTVTVGFTNGGVTCALAGAAMTGNTTSTVQSGVFLLQIDQSTPVTYSTAYASVGATAMVYGLWLTAEQVDA